MTLLDLATRCESATGRDRELDREIMRSLNLQGTYRGDFMGWDDRGRAIYRPGPSPYTSSIDAALTLVPEGWRTQLSDWDHDDLRSLGPWQAILTPPDKRGDFSEWWPRCNHAATPALALCAAALRARAQIEGQEA